VPVIVGNTFRLGKVEARLFDHNINASPIFPLGSLSTEGVSDSSSPPSILLRSAPR
jgi:hypothetical protein